MTLRPLSLRPPMDTLQGNDEGQQVLLMQQPAHAERILLPSSQVQHLPNRVATTTQQQIQDGGLWFGVTQANGMYFQPNQPMAQATLPINAVPARYVSHVYTQVQNGNQNYAPLEMNPATEHFARPNHVMLPSSSTPSNESMLAPVHGSISGNPHLDPAHCGVMLHGRSNLGMCRVASTTMDSFCVQDKVSTGLFDSNMLGPTNVLPGTSHLDLPCAGVIKHGMSNLGMPIASQKMDNFSAQDHMSSGPFDSNLPRSTDALLGNACWYKLSAIQIRRIPQAHRRNTIVAF